MTLSSDDLIEPKPISIALIVAGVLAFSIGVFISNPYVIIYPLMLLLGVVFAWVLFLFRNERQDFDPFSGNVRKAATICWVIGIAGVLLLFHGGYSDSLVFAATAFLLACTAILAVHGGNSALFAIFGAAIVHRIPMFFGSSLLLGSDTHYHANAIEALQEASSISALSYSKYFFTPAYQLFISLSGTITGLQIKNVSFWAMTVAYVVVGMVVAVALAKRLSSDHRVGPIAAYIFVVSDATLGWSVQPQAITFTFALFCVFIFSLSRLGGSRTKVWGGIVLILTGGLILTQHFASVVMVITSMGFLLSSVLHQRGASKHLYRNFIPILWLMFLSHWTFTYYGGQEEGLPVISTVAIQFIDLESTSYPQLPNELDVATVSDLTFIHIIGAGLMFAVAIGGILLALNQDSEVDQRHVFGLAATLGTIYAVIFAGPVGFSYLFPMRWFQFGMVLLAPFGAFALVILLRRSPARLGVLPNYAVLFLLITSMVLMGGSAIGRINDPVFDDAPAAERYETTEQEAAMYGFAGSNADRLVYSDLRAETNLGRYYQIDTSTINIEYGTGEPVFSGEPVIILERPYMYTHNAKYLTTVGEQTVRVHGPIPPSSMDCTENTVYTNGNGYNIRESTSACSNP